MRHCNWEREIWGTWYKGNEHNGKNPMARWFAGDKSWLAIRTETHEQQNPTLLLKDRHLLKYIEYYNGYNQ